MSGIWPDDIQCVALITFDVDGVSSWLRRDADNQAPVNNGTRLFGILMRWGDGGDGLRQRDCYDGIF